MRIFLAGVACVGKTTVGARLADLLQWPFFNLDSEMERHFNTSIERLRMRCLTSYAFSLAGAEVLKHILWRDDSGNCVIALSPKGLMGGYWQVIRKMRDAFIVVLQDTPENILERITFYDIDSRLIQKSLTDEERKYYLKDIRADVAYFRRSFGRAHVSVEIAGCGPDAAALKVKRALEAREATAAAARFAPGTLQT